MSVKRDGVPAQKNKVRPAWTQSAKGFSCPLLKPHFAGYQHACFP